MSRLHVFLRVTVPLLLIAVGGMVIMFYRNSRTGWCCQASGNSCTHITAYKSCVAQKGLMYHENRGICNYLCGAFNL